MAGISRTLRARLTVKVSNLANNARSSVGLNVSGDVIIWPRKNDCPRTANERALSSNNLDWWQQVFQVPNSELLCAEISI